MAGWMYANGNDEPDYDGYEAWLDQMNGPGVDDYYMQGEAYEGEPYDYDMGHESLWPNTNSIDLERGGILPATFRSERPGQVLTVANEDMLNVHEPLFTGRDLDLFNPDDVNTETGSILEADLGVVYLEGPDFSDEDEWSSAVSEPESDYAPSEDVRIHPGPPAEHDGVRRISDWSPGIGWHLQCRMLPPDYVIPLPYWT